jgi:hypothetical protein
MGLENRFVSQLPSASHIRFTPVMKSIFRIIRYP